MSDDWRGPRFPKEVPLEFLLLFGIISDLFDWLFDWLFGKAKKNIDIILYGPTAAGKTTFFNFLTSKEFVKEYNSSEKIEEFDLDDIKIEINTLQITNSKGKTIKFRKLKDLPGDDRFLTDLVKIVKATKNENSNIDIWIVYFIALPTIIEEGYLEIDKKKKETIELFKYRSNKYTKKVESDLNGIKEIIGQYKEGGVNSLIIFNFADLYPLYSQNKSLFEKRIINYTDNWIARAGGTSQVEYVIGSLGDEKEAKNLVTKTLRKIAEKN